MFHWEAVTYLPYQLLPRADQSSCYSSCLTMLTQCEVHADQLHSVICRHGMLSVSVKIEPDHDTFVDNFTFVDKNNYKFFASHVMMQYGELRHLVT